MTEDDYDQGKRNGKTEASLDSLAETQQSLKQGQRKILQRLPGDQELQSKSTCAHHRKAIWWAIGAVGSLALAGVGWQVWSMIASGNA
jgi:hypothetical protein